MNEKIYVVKSMRVCSYLMAKEFKLLRIQVDRNNHKFNVFLFEDNDELRKALSEYK